MPELPEVETVRTILEKNIINKTIENIEVRYDKIIQNVPVFDFINKLKGQTFLEMKRRGKYLICVLNDYYLIVHLRMEGKFFYMTNSNYSIHDHIIFKFKDSELRYNDTRKFGKMHLVKKDELDITPISKLGLEPWDKALTTDYLKQKLNKKKAIKTLLLNQSIISGIGNIYADEILFLSKINPEESGANLTTKNLEDIIKYTQEVLEKAISLGGTTIHTYTAVDGITGRFQQELLVHGKTNLPCPNCHKPIKKIVVNTRGTYYCPNCQK